MEEIRQEYKELTKIVGSIDKKMEVWMQKSTDFFKQNEKDHQNIMDRQEKTNGRVRGLERVKWILYGAGSILYVIVLWILNKLFN